MNLGSNHLPSPLEYREWIIETFVNVSIWHLYFNLRVLADHNILKTILSLSQK